MFGAIFSVIRKELTQTFRDKRMVFILFLAPVLQTLVFGFAVNLDLKAQPTVIADLDRTPQSRQLVALLSHNEGFQVTRVVKSDKEAERLIWRGQAAVSLHIPKGYGKSLEKGEAELLVVLDGSDSNTAVRAGQEVSQVLLSLAKERLESKIDQRLASMGVSRDGLIPRIVVEPRTWYNPQLKTAIYLVPGVLALVLMVITTMLTSMGLTREKEIGTLEQVMVSPLRSLELIIGKTVPFAAFGLADVFFVVSMATLVFDVPVRGSLLSLFGASLLFLMTTLGLGIFISTISRTQQQAMMNFFFVMLPALMISGYVFPVEHMPEAAQWLAAINPLTYFIEIARGLLVKGSSLADLQDCVAKLAVIGCVVLGAAALKFRKRVA